MAVVESGQVLKNISPNNISSPLLTPHQIDRCTIPTNGTHTIPLEPIGGHTWGENLTNYGGIGKLPFLGKTRARDLYVPRSHDHYGSGFSKYKSNVQPYQDTSLMKNSCRINDQILESPMIRAKITPWCYLLDLTQPGHELTPYFSHRSISDVFPHHDPCRLNPKTGQPELPQPNRDALSKCYNQIYHIPRYSNVFPYHKQFLQEQVENKKTQAEQNTAKSSHIPALKSEGDSKYKKTCENCTERITHLHLNLAPISEIIKRCGEAAGYFTAKDVLSLMYQYFGDENVQCVINICKASLSSLNECDCEKDMKQFGDYMCNKFFPLIEGLMKTGCDVLDVLSGKIPDPSIQPKEDKVEKVVDALHQCQTLRSFIVGTNITSFDRAIIADLYSDPETKKGKKNIKGIAPLWPPSRYYILNNQRMRLESQSSFPSNFKYQSEREELEVMENEKGDNNGKEDEEKVENVETKSTKKQVRFSDAVTNHNGPTYEYSHEKDFAGIDPYNMKSQAYQTYLDKILPTPCDGIGQFGEKPGELKPGRRIIPENIPRMLPPIPPPEPCRYPPGHPTEKRDDWRRRSIEDPNQHLKTLAQRRYHELYPEPIPDLRDNHRFSKKYFFCNNHASTFRG